jgi:twitching motility protein PilT
MNGNTQPFDDDSVSGQFPSEETEKISGFDIPEVESEEKKTHFKELKEKMNKMGIHPLEQDEILANPEKFSDKIRQIQSTSFDSEENLNNSPVSKGISFEKQEEAGRIEIKSVNDFQVDIADILDAAIESQASDIHMSVDAAISFRIDGSIHKIENIPPLSKEQAEKIIMPLVGSDDLRETLIRTKELDFSYEHADGTNFRVNVFFRRKKLSCVMRRIANVAFPLETLGVPKAVLKLLKAKQGLILLTGPTGSGKSTTMQSMLEYVNTNRVEHIITIEDPIEFVFTNKKCIFSQREIGIDTLSFANALRGALRQDPDVVMIGEMRDPETIMAAINLSETGHLVFSTLHTSGAPQTITRIVNAFPPDQQFHVQARLSESLLGVLSQRLVPRADNAGMIAIFEFMIVNAAIRNIVRTGDMAQIFNSIQSGRKEGMVLMQNYAEMLRDKGLIYEKDYSGFFREE